MTTTDDDRRTQACNISAAKNQDQHILKQKTAWIHATYTVYLLRKQQAHCNPVSCNILASLPISKFNSGSYIRGKFTGAVASVLAVNVCEPERILWTDRGKLNLRSVVFVSTVNSLTVCSSHDIKYTQSLWIRYDTIRYDTIAEFNVDSKAEYSALSSTRSQKKKLKQTMPVPIDTVREVSPEKNKSDYGWKDLWKRWVLSLEWIPELTRWRPAKRSISFQLFSR